MYFEFLLVLHLSRLLLFRLQRMMFRWVRYALINTIGGTEGTKVPTSKFPSGNCLEYWRTNTKWGLHFGQDPEERWILHGGSHSEIRSVGMQVTQADATVAPSSRATSAGEHGGLSNRQVLRGTWSENIRLWKTDPARNILPRISFPSSLYADDFEPNNKRRKSHFLLRWTFDVRVCYLSEQEIFLRLSIL